MKEYVERLHAAQRHFDWAVEPGEVDAAIYELKAAELSLSEYVGRRKNRVGSGTSDNICIDVAGDDT